MVGIVLLSEQEQRDRFASLVNTEITTEMLVSGPVPPLPTVGGPANLAETGLVLNMPRDRIQIVSTSTRTSIERQYPRYNDFDRLAEVASSAIDLTNLEGQTLRAFGFNIDLVYRQTEEGSSERYIADRLFSHRQFGIEEWTLVGGGGKLSFEGKRGRWNFTVEPRANDPSGRKVYLGLNLHREEQEIPSRNDILIALQDTWDRSREIRNSIGCE